MSDRRYSTASWQKLRRAVLAHYGHVCQVEGPRCTGYATTVHHILPSSQYPELFWNPENLEAACSPCNYGDGSRIAAENTRRTIERLYAIIEEQEQQIEQMAERLARYEDQAAKRRVPAIH
jgi:5-methylcytosine-specific restriction endonuclease McrA